MNRRDSFEILKAQARARFSRWLWACILHSTLTLPHSVFRARTCSVTLALNYLRAHAHTLSLSHLRVHSHAHPCAHDVCLCLSMSFCLSLSVVRDHSRAHYRSHFGAHSRSHFGAHSRSNFGAHSCSHFGAHARKYSYSHSLYQVAVLNHVAIADIPSDAAVGSSSHSLSCHLDVHTHYTLTSTHTFPGPVTGYPQVSFNKKSPPD
mmetsp:Transcript_82237/g.133474  ORF Transcript_82237/g.133474 Transcript_82237/m.133474 type:complete len:206 (-) Transcript_82237:365-982(-)